MKRLFSIITIVCGMVTIPTFADEYSNPMARDNYVGVRVHKNENIAFGMEPEYGDVTTARDDSFGFGIIVGNRLTDFLKIEFESEYTYGNAQKYGNDLNFDIWANMLNVYIYKQFGGAVEPYAGLGVGVSGLWGDVSGTNNMSDATADMSWSAMIGINFALNSRIDLNLGLKYQNYGDLEMTDTAGNHYNTEVDSTEFYIGAAYKFGL